MASSFSRREFLAGGLGVTTAGALHTALGPAGHLARSSSGRESPSITAATTRTQDSSRATSTPERALVLCTLYGGNDGLNTVVPYESSAYHSLRGDVAIRGDMVQPLGTVDGVALGLHPALVGLKSLWDAGQVAIILGVGYPDPNLSHFGSMEIMQSADPTGDSSTGWVGRWLDACGSDPTRALSVGPNLPQVFTGESQQASTLTDSTSPSSQSPSGDPVFVSAYSGLEHAFKHEPPLEAAIAQAGADLLVVGAKASAALTSQRPPAPKSASPAGDIGNQLDIVAELVKAGMPTKVYGVNWGSFDTHAGQLGAHWELLSQLDAGVRNFMGDFPAVSGRRLSPVIVIYSEFGRRVQSNASAGTDHGAASNVIVVGPSVKGGFYGEQPSLKRLDDAGNLRYSTDFRRVYATLLADIMGAEPHSFLGAQFAPMTFLG